MKRKVSKKKTSDNLKLTDKKHPLGGIMGVVFACVSFVLFVTLCIISSINKGKGGLIVIGMGGMICFFLSLAGLIMSFKTLKKEEIRYIFTNIAIGANLILTIVYMILYTLGAYLTY